MPALAQAGQHQLRPRHLRVEIFARCFLKGADARPGIGDGLSVRQLRKG